MVKNNNREGNKVIRDFLKEVTFTAFLLIFLLSASLLFASTNDDIYDAAGFDPNRQTLSSMPDENIDPFTGGLTLNHVDMRLPGNGGLDLVIQRTFNSKSVCTGWTCVGSTCSCSKGENTWLGYGWALHFGRLFKSSNVNIHHFVEMPDGSRHTAYLKSGSSFITKDYSLLDLNSVYVLTLTNGTKIYYGQSGPSLPNYPKHSVYYATKIQDVNGNTINIYYKSPGNMVSYIMDSVGRRIDFKTSTINGAARLTSISGPGVSVTYTHQTLTTLYDTILTRANLPVGNPWEYTYKNLELQSVKSPYGGVITYAYGFSTVNACGTAFTYRTVVRKSAGGSNISPGTWNLSYSQGTGGEYTQISDPCGRTIKYSYYGYGSSLAGGSMWKLGLPKSKEVVGEETTTYTWINSASISTDDYVAPYCGRDSYTYVPFIASQAIRRGGKTYTTAYSNYDGYGNPKTLSETGDTTRTKNLTYWYNTSNNIVQNKPSSEAVSGGFPGAFSTNYTYNGNGNLTQLNKYGIVTNHSYYTNGNLYSTTDANGNTTSYQWTNGKISKIINPIYSISRLINSNGTVASETNGMGYTMSFTYDGNLRPTKIQPPLGNPTTFIYPADNSYKYESRGNYYTYYYYDGFGRPSGTYDSKGVDTDIVYKSCGPKNYTTSNIGDTSYYDNFGRVTQLVHKDNSKITYSYSGSNVTSADEAAKVTTLTYNAFGDPDEKFLISVNDPLAGTTSYARNILGSLTKITQGSVTRSYIYDGKNSLTSETHPESGTINYTRDNVGNMTVKADALGTKNYTYDKLHRLTKAQYGPDTIYLDYDNADNRIGLTTPAADIDYTYDSANRLTQKTAVIASRTYTTRYDYDNNDNITQQYYPTGTWITYAYNGNNQVTYITGFGGNVPSVTYNTAGLPTAYTFSNGITTNNTYNSRNLTTRIAAGSAFDYSYSYDSRGNTTNIIDGTKSQAFAYDNLSRVTGFNGAWGTGTFTYDSTGNRLSKSFAGLSTSYSYSNNRLSSTSGGEPATYSYNGYGSLTCMTKYGIAYNLVYDYLNNLKGYKSGSTSLADFTYDGDGMRATKTAGGKTVAYHYDREGKVISETDSAGNLIADYIYLNGKLVAKKTPSSVYFYHTDTAGTPMAMTNMSRSVVWKADYKPFGEEQSISGTIENNEKFVGKEKDKETGLYYFGARYMRPVIGRFTTVDPARISEADLINPQRLNRYSYGLNNPYKYMDTTGKWAEDVHSGIGNFKYGTYTWARQAGFSSKDARTIANGNNSTDLGGWSGWIPLIGDQSRHFNQQNALTGNIGDSREFWASIELQRAVDYWKEGDYNAALGHLGKGLHSLQDKYAHRDWDTGLFGIERHPDWYDNWHDLRNAEAAKATKAATEEYLKTFLELTK